MQRKKKDHVEIALGHNIIGLFYHFDVKGKPEVILKKSLSFDVYYTSPWLSLSFGSQCKVIY